MRLRTVDSKNDIFIDEIKDCALIRELHVYGKTQGLKRKQTSTSQHVGIGTQLMNFAEDKAKELGYNKIAVISAVGTRKYYEKLGYKKEGTYMVKSL